MHQRKSISGKSEAEYTSTYDAMPENGDHGRRFALSCWLGMCRNRNTPCIATKLIILGDGPVHGQRFALSCWLGMCRNKNKNVHCHKTHKLEGGTGSRRNLLLVSGSRFYQCKKRHGSCGIDGGSLQPSKEGHYRQTK